MILIYRILTTLLYPFLIAFTILRKFKKKEDPIRYKEKIFISHFNVIKKEKFKLIWFHAASIGEFKSIIPIIKQLNVNNHNLKFLITTTTLSSGNLAAVELSKIDNAVHRYFPYDVFFLVDKFLNLWKPDKIFLVDSEIWPNLILSAKKNKIPLALINARLTSKSFNKWMIFPNVAKRIFKIFDLFLCSNSETKNNFKKLNLENVHSKGNIKLIEQINEEEIRNNNEDVLLNKRFWFAASTHKEEDIFCLKTHQKLKNRYNDLLTIIAPRHINRANQIKSICKKFNLSAQILNKNEAILQNKEIIIINYFGALKDYFKYSKSVFIGKSISEKFKDNGGQNPIEAAKLGCKIYHGPYVYNFKEIYKIFEEYNVSKMIENYSDLTNNLSEDLSDTKKESNKISSTIKNLELQTLKNSMKLIQDFINNDS